MSAGIKTKSLAHSRLIEVANYDPETGIFTRKIASPGHLAGQIMGCKTKSGHIDITIDYVAYQAHRLAWFYMNGVWPECELDHRNIIPWDNRYKNLRLADEVSNSHNRRICSRNTSGAKGVSFVNGFFVATIMCRGKKFWCGTRHETVDEAAHAYNKKAVELFGEFAVLNPIGADYV